VNDPLDPKQFREIAENIQQALGERYSVHPGTEFGAIEGKTKGLIGEATWVNPWTLLFRRSVMERFHAAGISLHFARALLNIRSGEFFEIEAAPVARLHPSCISSGPTECCASCGRQPYQMPSNLALDLASVPQDVPITRIKEFPTMLVISDALASVLSALALPDILMTNIETLR